MFGIRFYIVFFLLPESLAYYNQPDQPQTHRVSSLGEFFFARFAEVVVLS